MGSIIPEGSALPGRAERPAPRFFLIVTAATSLLLGLMLVPIGAELLLAAVLSAVLWPIRTWITVRVRGRSGLAAGALTVAVVTLLIGPLAAGVALVVRDGSDGLRFVAETAQGPEVAALVARLPDAARSVVADAIASLPRDLSQAVGQVDPEATAAVGRAAVAATGSFAFHAALMLVALFFMLVHGDELVAWLDRASPLGHGQTRELLTTFRRVSYSVVVSTVVTSGVQAGAALIGYLIARVPNPVFFAGLTFVSAFIPAIGAAVICLLAAGLLVLTGHPYMAGFLALWGVVVVGLVDNVVRPLLIRRGIEIHGAIVFFALLGGLAAFGGIGLLIGPLVVSLFLALLRMYHRDYSPADRRIPSVPGLPGDGVRSVEGG
jgi:predicted PurR-regulated permease PerM